ncbi:shikimate kinase [Pseudalkalibacillus salsuginis]|uniref:shikimate kinase n=1 Tax=Pseudalkalibacillus salsuginis TaxID=2910972 RepID=UPI001F20112A|nr:shikimate kinase [Pseudalkalibacillus salsuginis]MCF6408445.1 shikimate kinase [Pseudalkalibacillus salsuginis]
MRAIYLIGFMAAGKTSVGKALAEKMEVRVIDLDNYIEEKLAWDIPSIFERKGEVYFRDEEQSALQELPTSNIIVTTGGGVVLRKENRNHMKENGYVVYLEATVDTIFERLSQQDGRPLAKGKSRSDIEKLAEKRQPYYEDADLTVQTDGKTIEQVADEIFAWIKSIEIA